MATNQKVTPKIEILRNNEVINGFLLNRTRLVIGSAPGAHVRLKAPHIQPEHLVIELVNRRYLEAVNVSGDPHLRHQGEVFERVRLHKGSTITLGRLCFRLAFVPQAEQREQEEPPRPAPMPASAAARQPTPVPAPALGTGTMPSVGVSVDVPPTEPRADEAPQLRRAAKAAPEPAKATPPPPPPAPAGVPIATPVSPTQAATPSAPPTPVAPAPAAPARAAPAAMPTPATPGTGAPADELLIFLLIYPPGGGKRKRVRLPPGTYDIGRQGCDINLHYDGIVDRHLTLMVMPDGNVYVQAHVSDPPVLLGDAPLQLSPFAAGDQVFIGQLRFELNVISVDTVAAPVGQPASAASTPATPAGEPAGGGSAGAWVEAAMRSGVPEGSEVTDQLMTAARPPASLPVRRVSATDSKPRMSTGTDPKVSAKEWIRQAVEDTSEQDKEDVDPADAAPVFSASDQAAAPPPPRPKAPPRQRRAPAPQTGPEKAAEARFSQWATTTVPPEYRARKRRSALLTFLALICVFGCVGGGFVLVKVVGQAANATGTLISDGRRTTGVSGEGVEEMEGSYEGLAAEGSNAFRSGATGSWGSSGSSSGSSGSGRSSGSGSGGSGGASASGPTYGPGGAYSGSMEEGAALAHNSHVFGGMDPSHDPDLIAIGNPGPNAPVIQFGSPHLGGTVADDSGNAEAAYVRRVEELDFELAEETSGTRGWVDMREVETVLHSIVPASRMCYSRARETKPDLAGTMVLILTLGPSGQMTTVSLDVTSSSVVDTDLKRCVERQIKSRNYPIPKGGSVTFSYPFLFNPPD